jgi:uncharacterized protein (DUF2126 family)
VKAVVAFGLLGGSLVLPGCAPRVASLCVAPGVGVIDCRWHPIVNWDSCDDLATHRREQNRCVLARGRDGSYLVEPHWMAVDAHDTVLIGA